MELTDYTVYLWLWPATVHLIFPLVVSCIGLGVFVLRRAGEAVTDRRISTSQPSST